ncbi:hypothetical protein CRG98_038886 [Punica granatum]|uniref:Uncharacterized protein n=1 Tax=Punica granatum TaxID=22663 RepID=A0A2I0IA97_PUNGR|nr:hypothetical protein CRG98_038886 [Punica granatum]
MAEEQQPVISEQDAPPMPAQSLPEDTRVMSSPASTAYSGALPTHFPSLAQASSNVVDPVRFAALEGMVNQLATNMNTNMTELMAMLRDQNRASSSHTPPPECRTTVHRNPIDPPIYVTDREDISFPAMTYVSTISPAVILCRRHRLLHQCRFHPRHSYQQIPRCSLCRRSPYLLNLQFTPFHHRRFLQSRSHKSLLPLRSLFPSKLYKPK